MFIRTAMLGLDGKSEIPELIAGHPRGNNDLWYNSFNLPNTLYRSSIANMVTQFVGNSAMLSNERNGDPREALSATLKIPLPTVAKLPELNEASINYETCLQWHPIRRW